MTTSRHMSLRTALRTAGSVVHMPTRFGSDWVVSGPYDDTKIHGARTEIKRGWYSAALEARKQWVARLALHMLGYSREETECDLAMGFGAHCTTAKELVTSWIARP
jgi:hypothetical protein